VGILIKSGTLVSEGRRRVADIRCRDGVIVEVSENLETLAKERIVDAGGQLVFPGGVDPHVHMELPVAGTVSSDDFASGSAAGLAGGTTTLIDFVHPERGQDYLEALAARRLEGEESVVDFGLHMALTWWGERSAEWMEQCVGRGVPTFKIYLAYKTTVGIDDEEIARAMAAARQAGGMIIAHAEHGEVVEQLRDRFAAEGKTEPRYHPLSRPPELEGEATQRVARLAGAAGARLYVVHVTCREAVEALAAAQAQGWDVHGETCPQYLLLEDSVYDQPDFEGASFVIAPPIRPAGHQDVLWKALDAGVLEVVATDHCPFTMDQKRLGRDDFRLIPGGAGGIQHRLALLYTFGVGAGRVELEQFVDLISTGPAKRFGLYPRKGSLNVGSDADLVVWDPSATATISAQTDRHRCDRSIYEGLEVRGLPSTVIANGRIRFAAGELRAERGCGRFLRRRL